MKEINKFFYRIFFLLILTFPASAENKILAIGNSDANIVIKVFSSLTCPHCANFHTNVFEDLKKEYIDKGLVKFEHHPFPLDLAALNAEVILRCDDDEKKKIELLGKIYEKQRLWAVGSDIDKINNSIKKIGAEVDLGIEMMNNCLKNEKSQDEILNQRIEAQKKYKIEATPTIFVNEKKYTGEVNYNQFKKFLEKNL